MGPTVLAPYNTHVYMQYLYANVYVDITQMFYGVGVGVWTAVAADPRWPALQARLNAAGRSFGASFADISDMSTWPLNSTTDLRAHVWDAVMFERTAEIVNASYFEPIRAIFPHGKAPPLSSNLILRGASWAG
jgi:hypothetical protein